MEASPPSPPVSPLPSLYTIRAARRDDAAALVTCDRESFEPSDQWATDALDRATTSMTQLTRLAFDDEMQLVGFVVADRSRGRVMKLGVAPRARRRGVGRRLLDAALLALGGCGNLTASLLVDAKNGGALALYKSRGFVRDAGALGAEQHDHRDAVRMLRDF